MKQRVFQLLVICSLSCFVGCDDSFSPNAPYTPRLVVYSILSNDRTIQVVRVAVTSNPSEIFSNSTVPVPLPEDLRVEVHSNNGTQAFRDTVLLVQTNDGTFAPTKAFLAPSFAVQPGTTYQLNVSAPSFETVTATTHVPDTADLSLFNTPVLNSPNQFTSSFFARVRFFGTPKGYLLRVFVEYEVQETETSQVIRIEIPLGPGFKGPGWEDAAFPQLEKLEGGALDVRYYHSLYLLTLYEVLLNRHPHSVVIFKSVVAELVQLEEQAYNYYNIANGFNDQLSIRSDSPEYSNVSGGYGLFGAYTFHRYTHTLPADFSYNRK
jgi:hypothetical protein